MTDTLLSVAHMALQFVCLCHCISYAGYTVLFEGQGADSTFQNTYSGWYTAGSTVTSGSGKRMAYDTTPLTRLKFSDASGKYIEYTLNPGYSGKTLLGIVQQCMGTGSNTGAVVD